MSGAWQPREAQREILAYGSGRMAVSAVPGSGKTSTIAALAAKLIDGHIRPDQRVLVVTYQNSAANALSARIGMRLHQAGLPRRGFEVRTLHSLAHGVVSEASGLAGIAAGFGVADEALTRELLERAARAWRANHPDAWQNLKDEARRHGSGGRHPKLLGLLQTVGRAVIRSAKNRGLNPRDLSMAMREAEPEAVSAFLELGADLYHRYQLQLETAALLDFDDLVRQAVNLLDRHPELATALSRQWPYILEDEAQDSVPLQEALLGRLSTAEAHGANWVRVGDPNQAVTSSFTAADPGSFRQFMRQPDVRTIEMQESGRNARGIIALANHLVDWVSEHHPVPELRQSAFLPQHMRPTSADDPQPNPEDGDCRIVLRTFRDRDAELDTIVERAIRVAEAMPDRTLGILVPTNAFGARVAERLKAAGQAFDERLRGNAASRQVANLLASAISTLAEPLRREHLVTLYDALRILDSDAGRLAGSDPDRVRPLLRSCEPEALLFPIDESETAAALPPVAGIRADSIDAISALTELLRPWFAARALPVDQLILSIAMDALPDLDWPVASRLAGLIRQRVDREPERQLPDIAAELRALASGRQSGWTEDEARPFEPRPGVITLTTMHKAKGLEWDLAYLVGVDGEWFPHRLDDRFMGGWQWLGGDPAEEARASLLALVGVERHPGRSATDAAHIELIGERLRLLYVGITRARRWLSISWSQAIPRRSGSPRSVPMSEAWRELKRFVEDQEREA